MTSCRTFSPYGAWELKRTYQRNLLLANLCVVALVVAAVSIPSIWPRSVVLVAPPGGGETDTIEIVAGWDRPPVIRHEQFDGPLVQAPRELVTGIPIPIEDSLIAEFESPIIASRDELARTYDYQSALFDQAGGGGREVDVAEFIAPDIDSFVPVDVDAKMVHEVKPDYPRQARMTGMEGDVVVGALVGIDGAVRAVRLVKPSGIAALDLAAEEAAWKNRFSPAIRDGEPLAVWAIYRVSFRLNE